MMKEKRNMVGGMGNRKRGGIGLVELSSRPGLADLDLDCDWLLRIIPLGIVPTDNMRMRDPGLGLDHTVETLTRLSLIL